MSNNIITLGEYGQAVRINVNEDISSATLSMVFAAPNSPEVTKTSGDGLTVPNSNIVVDELGVTKTYNANEYAEYTLEEGLIDKIGKWRIRLIAEFAGPVKKSITQFLTFEVVP